MFKVGIDLSTTNIGVVVLNSCNDLIYKKDLLLRTFNERNYHYNFNCIKNTVQEIKETTNHQALEVGIELANFKNAMLTSRFSMYAGAFIAYFNEDDMVFKTFNSNQWQPFVGVKTGHDTRDITKMKSRMFVKEHCKQYKENWSEDLCDAYCIAYFLPRTLSNEQKTIEVKRKIHQKYQDKNKKLTLLKMIENRYSKLNKLDSKRNKEKINRLINEINKLKQEYESIK